MSRPDSLLSRLGRRLGAQTRVLVKNSSWVFAANGYRAVLALAKSVVIARGLGAELYGHYVLIFAFVVTVQEFFNLNVGSALIKFGADYRSVGRLDKLAALVKAAVVACAVLGALSVAVVAGVSHLFYDAVIGVPGLEVYVVLYALVASTTFVNTVSQGLLRLFFRFKTNSLIFMATGTLDLIVMASVLMVYPHALEPFLVAMIAAKLADSAILNVAAFWEVRGEFRGQGRAPMRSLRDDRRDIGSFVLQNSAGRTLKTLMDRGDVLLLGAFSTSAQVGLYDIAKKLAFTVLRLTDPLERAIYPQLAELISADRSREARHLLKRVTLGFGAASVLALAVAALTGEWVMATAYGSEFGAASALLLVHLASASIMATLFWALPAVQSLNILGVRVRITAVAFVVCGLVAFVLAPPYGALGVALAVLLSKVLIFGDMARASVSRLRVVGQPSGSAPVPQGGLT